MSKPQDSFQLFNLETMSGISPGIRTQIMQRVQLAPVTPDGAARGVWARLLWYAGPESTEQATQADGATCIVQLQAAPGGDRWEDRTLVQLVDVESAQLNQTMQAALRRHGKLLHACGSCRFWQPDGMRSADGLPLGLCSFVTDTPSAPVTPVQLASQSLFAPGCTHWSPQTAAPGSDPAGKAQESLTLPRAAVLDKQAEARRTLWARLRSALRRTPPAATDGWSDKLVERSGVGAGTEPCFACQGRIANLGALTVATEQGDKHTYSVWRCRSCYATYLNSWIDRWERLDSLETEESYFRLAPSEAVEILAVIDGVVGGEHPAGRRERTAQRAWFDAFAAAHPVLSHQIRQGR